MPEFIPENISENTVSNNVSNMTNVDKLLEATRLTNDVFKERGIPSGSVNTVVFLFTGKLECFTSTYGARLLASTIKYPKVLFEVQTRLLRIAADLASRGATLTDNEIMNLILERADIDRENPIYSVPEIHDFINKILQEYSNSDIVSNALKGRVSILEDTQDLTVLSDCVKVLEDYATLLDPDIEQKVIFGKK